MSTKSTKGTKFKQSKFSIDLVETGKRFKAFRKSLHLTTTDLVEATGLSMGMISETEAGRNKPSPTLLLALYLKYDLNINWLLTGEGEMRAARVGVGPRRDEHGEPVMDMSTLLWYMEHVPLVRHNMLGYFARFYYENEAHIRKLEEKLEVSPPPEPEAARE